MTTCPFCGLLGDGKQGVEVSLLVHQLLEGAGLCNAAVFQGENPVIAPQELFLQGVGDDDYGLLHVQNGAGNLEGRLGIQGGGGLIHQQNLGLFQKAPGNGNPLLFAAGQVAAVFSAEVILPLGFHQGGKP